MGKMEETLAAGRGDARRDMRVAWLQTEVHKHPVARKPVVVLKEHVLRLEGARKRAAARKQEQRQRKLPHPRRRPRRVSPRAHAVRLQACAGVVRPMAGRARGLSRETISLSNVCVCVCVCVCVYQAIALAGLGLDVGLVIRTHTHTRTPGRAGGGRCRPSALGFLRSGRSSRACGAGSRLRTRLTKRTAPCPAWSAPSPWLARRGGSQQILFRRERELSRTSGKKKKACDCVLWRYRRSCRDVGGDQVRGRGGGAVRREHAVALLQPRHCEFNAPGGGLRPARHVQDRKRHRAVSMRCTGGRSCAGGARRHCSGEL